MSIKYFSTMNLYDSKYSINQLRDYSSIFSRRQASELINGDFESLNAKLFRYDQSWTLRASNTYLDYVKHIYNILEANYRNEYVFKNSLLNKMLYEQIGKEDTKVFSEFRVGNSVADLVMFNGISKAFEIKTEFDTAKRLVSQLEDYFKVFNEVFLVIPTSKLKTFDKIHPDVGLILLSDIGKLSVIKDPKQNKEIDAGTVMGVLRTNEYKSIIKNYYGELPEMTSFTQYNICAELIVKIPKEILNKMFIKELKKRKVNEGISNWAHKELNQLALALNMSKKEKTNLITKLKTPITF